MTIEQHIIEALMTGVCNIKFTKSDGTERVMKCTRNTDLIPESFRPKGSEYKRNPNQVCVYDIEKCGWRSFNMNNLISMDLDPDMDIFETIWYNIRHGYMEDIPSIFVLTEAATERIYGNTDV